MPPTARSRATGPPILILTARDAIDHRVAGPRRRRRLLSGQAVRTTRTPGAASGAAAALGRRRRRRALRYDDLGLDPIAHEVRRGERLIDLSKTEFPLLELFLQATRARCSPVRPSSSTFGVTTSSPTSNALGVYMGYLRRKTEAGREPRLSTWSAASATSCGTSSVSLRNFVARSRSGGRRWRWGWRRWSLPVVPDQLRDQVDGALRGQALLVQPLVSEPARPRRDPTLPGCRPTAGGKAPFVSGDLLAVGTVSAHLSGGMQFLSTER